MAVSIGTLRMDIIARTDEFEKGLFKTRKEMRSTRRVFEKNLSVHDKYARSLNKADEMLKRGNLSIKLHRQEVARLSKEYREAHTFSGRFSKNLRSRAVAMAAAAVSIGTLVQGLRSLREGLTKIDDLDKKSKGMGESVANIQALAFAAGQTSGLPFETAVAGFEKMSKRVAEAAMGTGEAAMALKKLNIDAKELNKLKPYKQFQLLADAMEAVPHAGTRAALAAKLFDMEARRLHITMRGGAATLEEYKKQAEEMGILLDESMVSDAARANDAIDKLSRSWENFKLVLAAGAAPMFEGLAEGLQDLTESLAQFTKWMKTLNPDGPENMRRYSKAWMKEGTKGLAKESYKDIAEPLFLPTFGFDEKTQNEIFQRQVNQVQEESLLGWMMGWKPDRRKFTLVKDDNGDDADKMDDFLKEDGIKNIKTGMTAEQDSIEEYRFLLEKQQRENQARLTSTNIAALNNNTNAILQTNKRDVITGPKRINMREVELAP
jgi:hypothetical protein